MSDDDSKSNAPLVTYAFALGRLQPSSSSSSSSSALTGVLLADSLASQSVLPAKKVRAHLKAILEKGSGKLTRGKRLRLKSHGGRGRGEEGEEEGEFDVHLLTSEIDGEDPSLYLRVLFVLTVPDFAKYYSISAVFRDFQNTLENTINSTQMTRESPKNLAVLFSPIATKLASMYSRSSLRQVEVQVAQVKQVMSGNVARALGSVEQLEDMEETSERFEESSKQFHKKTIQLKKRQRNSFYALTAVLVVAVLVIILYLAIPAVSKIGSSGTVVSSTAGAG